MSLLRSLTANPQRVKQKRERAKTELDAIRGNFEPFGFTITINMEPSSTTGAIRFVNELRILDPFNPKQKMSKQICKHCNSFVIINLLAFLHCIYKILKILQCI